MNDPYLVNINGALVDTRDPCALWQALYNFKLTVLSGGKVDEFEIRSPVTTRRTKFGPSNLSALDAELDQLQAACAATKCGKVRRTRYAISGGFRPH